MGIHVAGVASALVAVTVLITLAAVWLASGLAISAVAVYGACLVGALAISGAYHAVGPSGASASAKEILRRLDHSAIYVLIAATYTPFVALAGESAGLYVLVTVWTTAVIGIVLTILSPRYYEWMAIILYLAMGWSAVVIGWPLLEALHTVPLILIGVGGALYTGGVAFHLWRSLPFHNAIWHAMVLAASFVFYAAVLTETYLTSLE
jgi:hemolysin III